MPGGFGTTRLTAEDPTRRTVVIENEF